MQEYFNVATYPVSKNYAELENNSNYFIYKNCFPKLTIEQIREGEFEKIINENTELFFTFSHYYNIICSLIKFNNLPGKYAKNLIMRILVQYGSCAICKKGDDFYIAPFFNKTAIFNESGEPVSIQLQEYTLFNLGRLSILNQKNEPLIFKNTPEKKEFCIIDSTPSNLPLFYVIYYYALKLVDVQSAIDNNIFAMQQPIIYRGIAEHKMDLQSLYEKFINKVRAFFILKRQGVSDNEIEVLDLKVKNNIETFENHKDYVKKEFFEFFGINAVPYEKKERMLVDEVNSNNMLLELVQATYFNTIQDSIKKCNETLETDIEIEFNINGFLGSEKGGEEIDENNEII